MNTRLAAVLCFALMLSPAHGQEKVLNLYSARHYQTDEALYSNFTRQTGIRINRIEGKEEELVERIRNEGANSPADVFITVDAARLAQADALGLFAPVRSALLEERIPAHLRDPDSNWFAFSTRARVIIYNKLKLKAADIGVALTSTLMMNPAKSTSIVQGVGLALPAQSWSRCDHCRSRERCNLVKNAA